jgi:hypothetical protein
MTEEELLAEIDAAIDSMRRTLAPEVLGDYQDIIAARTARTVADWYMYLPAFPMSAEFREQLMQRMAAEPT